MTTRSSLCPADCTSLDYNERRLAPFIVNNVVTFDNSSYVQNARNYTTRIGMIFNNKQYKLTSSHQNSNKKQTSYLNTTEYVDTSKDNVTSYIPMVQFSLNKKKLIDRSLDNKKYGDKLFSQERYLLKKKQQNFKCQQRKYICPNIETETETEIETWINRVSGI